jgi:ATP-dependent 26S proteasome regulatory subunit
MSDLLFERFQKGLLSHYPLFYVLCREEERLESLLAQLSRAHYQDDRPVIQWSAASGFKNQPESAVGPGDPLQVLRDIQSSDRDGFYLLKDLPALFDDNPVLVRGLRDLYSDLASKNRYVFISNATLKLPEALSNQVFVVDIGNPTEREIYDYLKSVITKPELVANFSEEWFYQCASAMKGMALNEVRHLLLRLIRGKKFDIEGALPEIYEEKASALLKEGCLAYIPKVMPIGQVGGLDNLKEWVLSRKSLFTKAAFEAGVPLPAGILFMGVSGCGKSMAAKVISSAWNLPLVRLDMNLVMSGAYGSPEYAFDRSLRAAEHISPVVLWIDEMENSFGYDDLSGAGGGNNSIFSSFLTWMQEKPTSVFVVATANRIEKLPAEVIRKGRFDQLFFLDLPGDEERRAIWKIHIQAYGADPETFNLNLLSIVSKDWSGAEIEQAVKSARIHAYQQNRLFNEKDITYTTARMVPLSKTMDEQIKKLRLWSMTRATPASKKVEA